MIHRKVASALKEKFRKGIRLELQFVNSLNLHAKSAEYADENLGSINYLDDLQPLGNVPLTPPLGFQISYQLLSNNKVLGQNRKMLRQH